MSRRFLFRFRSAFCWRACGLKAQVKDFAGHQSTPRNPAPGDWLNWRRTDNAWGYSPLDQINTRNVQRLQLAWSWRWITQALRRLRHLSTTGSCTCRTRTASSRRWTPRRETCFGNTALRGLAARATGSKETSRSTETKYRNDEQCSYHRGGRIRSGKLARDTQVADHGVGYEYTSGPIVIRGKVIAGTDGAPTTKRDGLLHHRARCGNRKEVWRTSTVAVPVSPAAHWGDSADWSSARVVTRGSPAATHPETNTVYPGTARPNRGLERPRNRRRRPLYQLDAGARSGHGKNKMVLPTPSWRNARHG